MSGESNDWSDAYSVVACRFPPYGAAVQTEPADLDQRDLAALVEHHWGLHEVELEYLPVGFGGHHWRAVDRRGDARFVTADDLSAGFRADPDAATAFGGLERAYGTAAALRECGLEFVLGPGSDRERAVVRRLDDRYAVSVAPYVDGESSPWGDYESARDRRAIAAILGRLHAATEQVRADLPRRDEFALPCRDGLDAALRDIDGRWDTGPFGEAARRLLAGAADAVQRRLTEYDGLVDALRDGPAGWVVTHGEPHRANVLRGRDGRVYLVDWDTTLLAPRERDLWWVLDAQLTGWDEYREAAGDVEVDVRALELYRRRWELADIAVFVVQFRGPHERTEDTTTAFDGLTGYLGNL
jgi:spectinomycin phosphotransferase